MPTLKNWKASKRIDGEFCRSNQERANAAKVGLHSYALEKEGRPRYDDLRSMLIDLQSDLCHLAASQGIDPEEIISSAHMNFESER